ncbi:MAG TPA: DUF3127 domain-containing protein, partial [Vampirovibrionales bacterium]
KQTNMEIIGKILKIGNTETFGSKGFKKRELVIVTDETYPQTILIEFVQDKTELLDTIKINQVVKVDFDLRGREWTNPQGETKYFNSVQGWKLEKVESNLEEAATIIDDNFPPEEDGFNMPPF